MRLAIMQPYFMPYIGYFQLIAAVDLFIIYDNIEYTKKGWINRNRLLQNGTDCVFSLPLKKDSDFLHIRERELAASFDRRKLLNQIKGAYQKAPYFDDIFPLVENIVTCNESNLFEFLRQSIAKVCCYLNIGTEIRVSSSIPIDKTLKNQEKVIALNRAVGANIYINSSGGMDLYDKKVFAQGGIQLQFIKPKPLEYRQFAEPFVSWLSIIDVLMFCDRSSVMRYLKLVEFSA